MAPADENKKDCSLSPVKQKLGRGKSPQKLGDESEYDPKDNSVHLFPNRPPKVSIIIPRINSQCIAS